MLPIRTDKRTTSKYRATQLLIREPLSFAMRITIKNLIENHHKNIREITIKTFMEITIKTFMRITIKSFMEIILKAVMEITIKTLKPSKLK